MAPRHPGDPVQPKPAGASAERARQGIAQLALPMRPEHYRKLIIDAVAAPDGKMLDMIVVAMVDAERAKQILRAKGYGVTGQPASETARLVPDA